MEDQNLESPKLMRAEDVYLSVNELSQLTGCTFPTVRKRLEGLTSVKGPHSAILYALPEAIPAIYKKENESVMELKLKREQEETRLATARAHKIELENAVKEKLLIPLEEAEREFAELVMNFKYRMLSIPSKAAFEVLQYKDPADAESYLSSLISEAFDELTRETKRKPAVSCQASS